MKKLILLLHILFLSVSVIVGQSRWIHQYLETFSAASHDFSTSYDDGFLLAGTIVPGYQFTWIIKTDINGNILWEKKVQGYYDRIIIDYFKQNKEGEIFLSGGVTQDSKTDPLIMKLNACGEKEWCRTLSTTSNYDFYDDVVTTSDGGCVALVINAYHPLFINREGLLRFSSDGTLLWQQYYQSQDQGILDEVIYNLLVTPDNGFLMTGYCYYPDPNPPFLYWLHPYYIKVDSLGNFEWEIVLYNETADIGGKAWQTILNPSGTFYYSCISHYYTSDTLNAKRPALVKMDLAGNVMGVYDLVSEEYNFGTLFSAAFINDSLLAGGASWFYSDDPPQSRAVIFDTLGNIRDSLTLLNTGWLAKTAVTHDGKLLFYNTIEEDGDFDTYLFKLTQDLEQDTFYTRPFTYDSLCPYQIVSDTIVPDDCGVIVGIEEETRGPGDKGKGGQGEEENVALEIWPNPAKTIVNCQLSTVDFRSDLTLVIYDIFGREVQKMKIPDGQDEVKVNVESYPPGVYIAILRKGFNLLDSRKFFVVR